jgi:hypothetical protein
MLRNNVLKTDPDDVFLKSEQADQNQDNERLALLHFEPDSKINGLGESDPRRAIKIKEMRPHAVYKFKNRMKFDRTSWVALEHWFIVELKYFKSYDYKQDWRASLSDYQLDDDSCELLMQNFERKDYPRSNTNDDWVKLYHESRSCSPQNRTLSAFFSGLMNML